MRTDISLLTSAERRDLVDKLLVVAQKKLLEHKLNGIKFKEIAKVTGLPKPRISEIYRRIYISKNTLLLLLQHKYLDLADIESAGLSDAQFMAVRSAIEQV